MKSKLLLCIALYAAIGSTLTHAQFTGAGYKVAVIDSGVMLDDTSGRSIVVKQLCGSRADGKTPDSTNALNGFVHYNIASTCPSGGTNLNSTNSAILPRVTEHNFHDAATYNYHSFGSPHGSNVINEVRLIASSVGIVAVNDSYYSANAKIDPLAPTPVQCGYHSASEVNTEVPLNAGNCYLYNNTFNNSNLINQVLQTSNLAAINVSLGQNLSCNTSSSQIASIVNSGIAIIAASGNSGSGSRVGWPACNQHVISVGAGSISSNGGSISSYTSDVGIIDFFADGEIITYDNNNFGVGTSYATPIISGAFALMKQARPSATIFEMKYALTTTARNAGKTILHNGTDVPFVDKTVALAAASCLQSGQCLLDNDNGAFDAIAYHDAGYYGSIYYGGNSTNYTFEIDFDNLGVAIPSVSSSTTTSSSTLNASTSLSAPGERDVVLSFNALMSSSIYYQNGYYVYINNQQRAVTGFFSNSGSFEYTLSREYFSSGKNSIRIQPIISSRPSGISNIKAEFTPVVELLLNVLDTNQYGSEEIPERPTGLRTSFNLTDVNTDVTFAVTGWDITGSDELAIYLNGKEYGHLSTGPTSDYNNGDVFTFAKGDLIIGVNVIEFVLKSGATKWAVTNLLATANSQSSSSLTLGVVDQTKYGNNYGTDNNLFQLNASFIPQGEHDHKISWRAYDVDVLGDLDVYLNNTLIKSVNTSVNLGATESITLAWRMFQSGVNTLSFRAKINAFDDTWGVTELLVKKSDVINLDNSSNLYKDFGYYELHTGGVPAGWVRNYSSEDYQTRLYATFDNTGTEDRIIYVTGWDIDSASEMSIYLNGNFLQYITSPNQSSIYSATDRIVVPAGNLLTGANTISFKVADSFTGFQNEKWGLTFGKVATVSDVNVAPIIMLLLSD